VVVLEIEEAAGEKEEVGKMLPMMLTGRVRPKSEMGMLSAPAMARLGEERQASTPTPTTPASAKGETVPADDDKQTTTSTEANVALALAQLTQSWPSKSQTQSYPARTEIPEEDKKSQLGQPLPTAQALALVPASTVTPHADASQAALQAKAKTKGTKRWSRILPWK